MDDQLDHAVSTHTRDFTITVLGRTLEHLGVQMYKRRDVAIAELVANCWDAGATHVTIMIPEPGSYDPDTSSIVITDDGAGMDEDQVQNEYLVVGRNRRKDGSDVAGGRPVMGRKGIGKLAGFGVASKMTVITWRDGVSTKLELDVAELTKEAGVTAEVPLTGIIGPSPSDVTSPRGTRVVLSALKHSTPLDLAALREALGRRFSRMVLGHMAMEVNGEAVVEPRLDLEKRVPDEGLTAEILSDGNEVKYFYAFSNGVIHSSQMRGFTIHTRGKTAQAPPYFFSVEGTASGQHGTRYLTGAIEADYLDEGTDNETDRISTDRQEIDWEDASVRPLLNWGAEMTRKALREWAQRKGDQIQAVIEGDPVISSRIDRLEDRTRAQVWKFVRELGQSDAAPERAAALAEAIVRAYEYRQFHDIIDEIEEASADPVQLHQLVSHLIEWKVLESRAILEIIKGRLHIIDKFHGMIVNNAAETAHKQGDDNMHDLLAGHPWLLNPDWQVLYEEKRISTQLREWNYEDVKDEDARLRYDFLALTDDRQLVIIEIKRAGHAITFEELQRLDAYRERLSLAHGEVYMMMICAAVGSVSETTLDSWQSLTDREIRTWKQIYERTHRYYEHYRAVLEGDIQHDDFSKKEREVSRTREVLEKGSVWRGVEERRKGIAPQDVDYTSSDDPAP
jgi:hypothetical protein